MYCWGGYSIPAKGHGPTDIKKNKKGSPYGYQDGTNFLNKIIIGRAKWSWSKLPRFQPTKEQCHVLRRRIAIYLMVVLI